jgi:hypothetical protein
VNGHFLFATLDNLPQRTTGFMDIDITGGTFHSSLPVDFQILVDSFTGPDAGLCPDTICKITFTADGNWGRTPPPLALTIGGVDYQLNGTNTNNDFWPANFKECSGPNDCHPVTVTTPEPSALLLLGVGLLAAAAVERKRIV